MADENEASDFEVGIKPLLETSLGARTFREDREGETWFITMSWWTDVEAMASSAGADPTAVHHLPRDKEVLMEFPSRTEIWELRHSHGAAG